VAARGIDDGIDWRDIFRRYVDHVGACEGVSFLPDLTGEYRAERYPFSREELVAMWQAIDGKES